MTTLLGGLVALYWLVLILWISKTGLTPHRLDKKFIVASRVILGTVVAAYLAVLWLN